MNLPVDDRTEEELTLKRGRQGGAARVRLRPGPKTNCIASRALRSNLIRKSSLWPVWRRSALGHAYQDLRKGYDGLSALVRESLGRDPTSGDLYLFVSRNRIRAKVLLWDCTGLCVFMKRLEQGCFATLWERVTSLQMEIREVIVRDDLITFKVDGIAGAYEAYWLEDFSEDKIVGTYTVYDRYGGGPGSGPEYQARLILQKSQ